MFRLFSGSRNPGLGVGGWITGLHLSLGRGAGGVNAFSDVLHTAIT